MFQKIIIAGNLGRDPEMRYMTDGTAVTNLSVAANRKWTDKASGELVEETAWFRITVWGRQAETANQYLSRGSKVLVEGRLNVDPNTGGPRIWTRQDGTAGASFEITASAVRFLGGGSEEGGYEGGDYADAATGQKEEEIPF